MSFRIRTTHFSLETNPQPKTEEKSAISFFEIPDEKDTFTKPTYVKQSPNVVKSSDSKGMAIRKVSSVQADHI
jgi:hypothetical protein